MVVNLDGEFKRSSTSGSLRSFGAGPRRTDDRPETCGNVRGTYSRSDPDANRLRFVSFLIFSLLFTRYYFSGSRLG